LTIAGKRLYWGMKNSMQFKIETDEYIYELETTNVGNFIRELSKTLKKIGELEEGDVLEISSELSPEAKKILNWAGY
jgi:hypothetical protein